MAEEKSYKSTTGVDEFYYGVLAIDTDTEASVTKVDRVRFLQSIEVELPQEIVRAYGDNQTAELAVTSGNVSVSTTFHTVPIEDKIVLHGLETVDGVTAYGANDNPPYVACVFAKTYESGAKEWVGLTKGMFMRASISGATKEDGTEFTSDEVTSEFMERFVEGFTTKKTVLLGRDEKGETTVRDALFMNVFGVAYPGASEGGVEG